MSTKKVGDYENPPSLLDFFLFFERKWMSSWRPDRRVRSFDQLASEIQAAETFGCMLGLQPDSVCIRSPIFIRDNEQ